ncbi:hypothetical protein [Roseibium sp. Sym1]|uniref:hypothetical protein n=1 Tax=Roseibium sp. Sym1 TaxID=3016006 RepID=UPI0022B44FA2|nr:hypothetical protein [Roseibium sp. Sym1]
MNSGGGSVFSMGSFATSIRDATKNVPVGTTVVFETNSALRSQLGAEKAVKSHSYYQSHGLHSEEAFVWGSTSAGFKGTVTVLGNNKYNIVGEIRPFNEQFDFSANTMNPFLEIPRAVGRLFIGKGAPFDIEFVGLHGKMINGTYTLTTFSRNKTLRLNLDRCFLAGTMVDMWPVEAGLKPAADGLYNEEEVRAKVWQKPIEEVTANDWVLSFDQDGNLKPGRVKQTFENEAKIILDFHGTFVTPAHVYYCAGGTYEGKFVPLIDILRDDGVVQHADGSLIRASTGCEVGSEDDKPFWAFMLYEDKNGMERVREKRQLRLGTRWMMPNGKHFSMREYMEGCGIELVESGELEGYVRFRKTGLTTVFAWTLSDTLPNTEDFVLRRSQTTLEDIYRASEWESVHPQMPAPVTMDSGPVQPLSVQQFDDMPRNNPIGFKNNSPSSELKLNRKARKAEAARQRKIKKSRQKADKAMGTLH